MKKHILRWLSAAIAALMLIAPATVLPATAEAVEVTTHALPAGDAELLVGYPLPDATAVSDGFVTGQLPVLYSDGQKLGNTDFCYSRLSSDEQKMYCALDDMMLQYVAGEDFRDKDYSDSDHVMLTAVCNGISLSTDKLELVLSAYLYDNPQYYWVSNSFGYSVGTNSALQLLVDPYFYEAVARAAANYAISATESIWLAELDKYDSDYDKVRVLHNIICEKTDYAYNSSGQPETAKWAHSIYGVLGGMGAVCDGYSKTFQYLLNKQGIDTACIAGTAYSAGGTSLGGHSWNAVRLDGSYYTIDVTWDDIGDVSEFDKSKFGYCIYDYFCTQYSAFSTTHKPYPTTGIGCYVTLSSDTFSDSTDHEYYRVYNGYMEGVTQEELGTFAGAAVDSRPDSLIFIANSSQDMFGMLLTCLGSDEYICLSSDLYGYVMIVRRERLHADVPAAPEFMSATPSSVTLRSTEGYEYSLDKTAWQTSPTFTGLTVGQTVRLYQRVARGSDNYASEASEALEFVVPTADIAAPALTSAAPMLGSNISMLFDVDKSSVENYQNVSMLVSFRGEDILLKDYVDLSSSGVDSLRFSFDGIVAKTMADSITAVAVCELGESVYYGTPVQLSIKDYCMFQLNNSTDSKLKTLCADLLNYGAASQKYFNYNTEALANADMTSEHQAFATSAEPVLTSRLALMTELESPKVSFVSAMLDLRNSVGVACVFRSEVDVGLLSFEIWIDSDNDSIKDEAEVQTIAAGSVAFEDYNLGGEDCKLLYIDGIAAGCMRSDIYVTAYAGEEAVSRQLRYSIESYAAAMSGKSGTLAELCKALMKYSDAALAYSGN